MTGKRTLSTVDNALRLMVHMARPPGSWGVSQLSRDLDLGKSVVHSLLQTLKARGFVEQDADSSYRLGYSMLALSAAVSGQMGIRQLALPEMHELARRAEEAVYLMVLGRNEGILIERVDPSNHVRVTMEVGQTGHLHAGCSHKVMLAFLSDDEIDRYIEETGLPRLTPHTVTDPEQLRRDLAEVRRHGYVYTEQESFEGIGGVAAPIFDASDRPVASISLAGFMQRLQPRSEELAGYVLAAANRISRALGHTRVERNVGGGA